MYSWDITEMRRLLDAGEPVAPEALRRLLDAIVDLARAARLPAEFLVRVHRKSDGQGWAAEHPLFHSGVAARHPADALITAGLELRRVLAREYPEYDQHALPDRLHLYADPVPEQVWAALTGMEPSPDTVAALAGALDALGEAREALNDLRYGETMRRVRDDLDADPDERHAARTELRRRHRERLADVGVEGADDEFSDDAFGPADAFGIELPVLVVGFEVGTDWPHLDDDGVNRPAGGRWVALEHRWRNEDALSRDPKRLRVVARPVHVAAEAELALRRVAEAAPSGRSVRDHVAYHQLMAEHLPGVSVDRVTGWVSPAALPIDLASLDRLVADAADLDEPDPWIWDKRAYWLSDVRVERW
jgi:hypothetical protein